MMKRCAAYALFAAVVASGTAPVLAQSAPEGQSCGGLLCDMGVFGHKTPPKVDAQPAAVVAPAAPGRHAEAATPAEELAPGPTKRAVRKKKRIAKIAPPAPPPIVSRCEVPAIAAQIPARPRTPAQSSVAVENPVSIGIPTSAPAPAVAAASKPASAGQAGDSSAAALPPPPAFRFRTLY